MKLNKIKQLSIGLATILLVNGCNSLDISNLWNYDADLVWNDDNLATAYVISMAISLAVGLQVRIIQLSSKRVFLLC